MFESCNDSLEEGDSIPDFDGCLGCSQYNECHNINEGEENMKCQTVTIGGVYQHSKTKGVYQVIGISAPSDTMANEPKWDKVFKAGHTELGEDLVVYQVGGKYYHSRWNSVDTLVLYHRVDLVDAPVWARPKEMFEETVELNDVTVPRLQLLYPQVKDNE